RLDDIYAAKEGSSRVLTQFIVNLVTGEPIRLVDGGEQKRCFTWVEDGIDLLMRIIENPGGVCDGEIFNVGNPYNECSVVELAKKLAAIHDAHHDRLPNFVPARLESVSSDTYFGKGYQDMVARKPSIKKARRLLGWDPKTTLDEALERTYEAFLEDWLRTGGEVEFPAVNP
ncbi:MAG TPA: NAD-dependent epimerase/dehydratase family protein, partial [Thermoanaerobaculia bacterium]|nr:NAD-dependent epimerase/dehydratase family protein [Thermoanaerobaculia bacterium]